MYTDQKAGHGVSICRLLKGICCTSRCCTFYSVKTQKYSKASQTALTSHSFRAAGTERGNHSHWPGLISPTAKYVQCPSQASRKERKTNKETENATLAFGVWFLQEDGRGEAEESGFPMRGNSCILERKIYHCFLPTLCSRLA